jgi:hypothetical protein
MEGIIISVIVNTTFIIIKTSYDHKNDIKNKLKNIYNNYMDKQLDIQFHEIIDNIKADDIIPVLIDAADDFIDQLVTSPILTPELKTEDIYNHDDSEDDKTDKISVAQQLLNKIHDNPITIKKQKKSNYGFNPSVLIEKLRSITPNKIIKKTEEIKKEIINDIINPDLDLIIKNIMKFIILELNSQHIENAELQDYHIYTQKLISTLHKGFEQKIKVKS